MELWIRRARAEEAELLSQLALRSKGYWGYEPEFLEACRKELTLSPSDVDDSITYVLEGLAGIQGYYRLSSHTPQGELLDLFLEPAIIKQGWGRTMWNHLVESAKNHGIQTIRLAADPNAEAFYKVMGCIKTGETPSASFPNRFLPLMGFEIPDAN